MQIKNAQANSFGPLAIDWLLWMQHKPSARWSDFDWQLYGRNQEILVQKQQEKPLKVSCCSYSSVQWTWAVCLVRTAAAQNNNHSSNNRERENSRLAVRETRTRQLLSWIEFQLDSLYIVMSQQHQMPRSHTHSYTGPAVCVCVCVMVRNMLTSYVTSLIAVWAHVIWNTQEDQDYTHSTSVMVLYQ